MTEGEVHLAFFLLQELDILAPTNWIIYANEMAHYGLIRRKQWLHPMP
jgi:hypothetical protein